MDSSSIISPTSEERFWSTFGNRVDAILENRKRKSPNISGTGESECEKRFKEDSLLLLRGFDSVASSLSQLTSNLSSALQGANDLAKPSLTEVFQRDLEKPSKEEEIPQKKGEQCSPQEPSENLESDEKKLSPLDVSQNGKLEKAQNALKEEEEIQQQTEFGNQEISDNVETKNKKSLLPIEKIEKLKKARNLALSMATKAASLARELKSIRSDLSFVQDRCILLEEENRRLRDGFAKGLRPEEDDLVRLQLEALLAEKSRLANENANLTRENQCLHQLVEYHQLTTQDHHLSETYVQTIHGTVLDFSSPLSVKGTKLDEDDDFEDTGSDIFEFPDLERCDEEKHW